MITWDVRGCLALAEVPISVATTADTRLVMTYRAIVRLSYLSELRRDFLASIGITYAVFRIAKSRLRHYLSNLRP